MRVVTQVGARRNGDVADMPSDTEQSLPNCPVVTVTPVHKRGVDAGARLQPHLRDKPAVEPIPSLACAQDSSDPAGLLWLQSRSRDAHSTPGQPCSAWDYFFDRISMPVG
jgi:hypothetical protein